MFFEKFHNKSFKLLSHGHLVKRAIANPALLAPTLLGNASRLIKSSEEIIKWFFLYKF